ncbi:MAG: hypothetical protein ACR2JV_01475 [Gaiellales bacterium]
MAALVSTPVQAYATTAAWIAAPAIGTGDFAWLEVGRGDSDVRAVAAFRGDRLVIRTRGRNVPVVHEPCTTMPCNTVQAPVSEGDGTFAYAVAFPGTGGYVATVSPAGQSTIVAEDQTDPHDITTPHPVAVAGATVVWVDNNTVFSAPSAGGPATTLVTSDQAGGAITSIAASAAGVAWAAKPAAGGTMIGVRTNDGAIATRASEPDARVATVYSVALVDDGTVLAMRRTLSGGRQRIALTAYAADGSSRTLLSSVAFGTRDPFEVTRPSVAGARAAVRLRGGKGGSRDEIWVVDLATGRTMRVTATDRSEARLTDPSLGAGRLVWAKDALTSRGRLLRASLYSAAVRP